MNTYDANNLYMKQWNLSNTALDRFSGLSSQSHAQDEAVTQALGTNEITPQSLYASMYQKGQVLTGEILDILHNDVKLQLSDGTVLNATLSDTIPFSIGDTSLFVVKEATNHTLLLKYMPQDSSSLINPSIEKALEGAGLPKIERNLTIVRELMKQQMSIDKNSIQTVIRQAAAHKDISMETLIKLIKHDLPVTSANAAGIEAASTGNHLITTLLPNMIDSVSSYIKQASPNEALSFLQGLAKQFPELNKLLGSEEFKQLNEEFMTSSKAQANSTSNEVSDSESKGILISEPEKNLMSYSNVQPDSSIKQMISQTDQQISSSSADLSALKQQITSILKKDLLFGTEHVYDKEKGLSKDGLTQYYNKLSDDIESLVKFLTKETSEHNSTSLLQALRQTEQIKGNIDFMKSMNQFYGYVQLPPQSKEDPSRGELFVYTNQRRQKQPDAPVSVLLHLTKPHLGEIDFHLVLLKSHLTANITVTDESVLNLINAHLPEFCNQLEQKNYTVSALVTQKEKTSNPLRELFESAESDSDQQNRYSFDKRA